MAFCPVSPDRDDGFRVDQRTEVVTELEERSGPVGHDGGKLLAEQGGVFPGWSLYCNVGSHVVLGECFLVLSHFIQVLARGSERESNRTGEHPSYVTLVLGVRDCLRQLLLYDGWGWRTAESGVGDEYFGYAIERSKVDVAVGTLFALVALAERERMGWTSNGEVGWTETGVDASLHDGVDLGGHHLGYIWGTMGVWLLVLVRVRLLAAAHCSVRW